MIIRKLSLAEALTLTAGSVAALVGYSAKNGQAHAADLTEVKVHCAEGMVGPDGSEYGNHWSKVVKHHDKKGHIVSRETIEEGDDCRIADQAIHAFGSVGISGGIIGKDAAPASFNGFGAYGALNATFLTELPRMPKNIFFGATIDADMWDGISMTQKGFGKLNASGNSITVGPAVRWQFDPRMGVTVFGGPTFGNEQVENKGKTFDYHMENAWTVGGQLSYLMPEVPVLGDNVELTVGGKYTSGTAVYNGPAKASNEFDTFVARVGLQKNFDFSSLWGGRSHDEPGMK